MSNPHQAPKKSPPKKTTPPSSQSSTPDSADNAEPEEFDPALAMQTIHTILANQQTLADEMRDIRDFHKTLEDASENDMRLYWEVRLIKGKDTAFAITKGTSSLPGLLGPKMRPNAPSMIQQEIVDKIAQPLTASFMSDSEREELEKPYLLEDGKAPSFAPTDYGSGQDVLGIASGGRPPTMDAETEEVTDEEEDSE